MKYKVSNISVIICSYAHERWRDLITAIESVQKQTLPPKEIIVVVDHNPLLLKQLQEQVSDIAIVENTHRRGLSGARNSGLTVATGQIIAFLDDDAIATPEWLMTLIQGFSDPHVLGIGGAIIPLWSEHCPNWLPEEFFWVLGCTYRGMPQTITPVRNLIGANMSFRREIFHAVGGFRSEIGRVGTVPMGCEETELCIRANQHWPERFFLYHPQAKVYHRIASKRTQRRYFYARCYSEGLSKACITQVIGRRDGLLSERSYVLGTLLPSIIQNLTRCDVSGLQRAEAIVTGLSITILGYLLGTMQPKLKHMHHMQKNRNRIFRIRVPNILQNP